MVDKQKMIIIGGGLSTLKCLQHISEHLKSSPEMAKNLTIEIVTADKEMGQNSIAWDKDGGLLPHYFNVTDRRMGVLPEEVLAKATESERQDLKDFHVPRRLSAAQIELGMKKHLDDLKQAGMQVTISSEATAIGIDDYGDYSYGVTVKNKDGKEIEKSANYVVVATGHWQGADKKNDPKGVISSPWPAKELMQKVDVNQTIAVQGAGLTAVDTILTLAHKAGRFEKANGAVKFIPNEDAKEFKVRAFSPHGMLPTVIGEHEKVENTSPPKTNEMMDGTGKYISLDKYFRWMCDEYQRSDYSKATEEDLVFSEILGRGASLENASKLLSAFYRRAGQQQWLEQDLAAAKASIDDKHGRGWQSFLRDYSHDLELASQLFSAEDKLRFDEHLKPLVAKLGYGIVPKNAEQIVALMKAGCLDVVELGKYSSITTTGSGADIDYMLDTATPKHEHCDVLVKAIGDELGKLDQSSPLMKSLLTGRLAIARHHMVSFKDQEAGKKAYEAQEADPKQAGSPKKIIKQEVRGGQPKYYLDCGGVAIDLDSNQLLRPDTGNVERSNLLNSDAARVVEPDEVDLKRLHKGLFTLGPPVAAQLPLLHGILPISSGAVNIVRVVDGHLAELGLKELLTKKIQATSQKQQDGSEYKLALDALKVGLGSVLISRGMTAHKALSELLSECIKDPVSIEGIYKEMPTLRPQAAATLDPLSGGELSL